ncbi:MAG: Eco57I restriction-modification methylase domain-containing protein [Clostridia bacterium]|nr:Eco57I restriction-modification methylase domain-containing protein [Clostridia bacterium]
MNIDTSVIDGIIYGRVQPHIYAFSTNTFPNFLKVGDTYRPVAVRLNEWRTHYHDLQKVFEKSAVIDDSYFRDFSVHKFLELNKQRLRLQKDGLPAGVFYSCEFFKDATVEDIGEAVKDIEDDYRGGTQKYQYYNVDSHQSEEFTFVRNQFFELRPNQKDTVEKFKTAVANGRTNLLMYAVMRFGKSFTAMCCAVEMDAKLVVVTSAKADVLREWKRTVESHVKFADYDFLYSKSLLEDENAISNKLASGRKVVVFLTLQDLQGEDIKEKHKDLFAQQIDLLLIDETHFGARAEKYGEVLKSHGLEKDIDEKLSKEESLTLENYNEIVNKELSAKIRIHLSGTPYKILMGSEFGDEDRIAFYQFTDIVQDQEAWDRAHVLDDDFKEWDNPYYGFPQMVRFAFNPNESSRRRLEELKKSGVAYAFSALLKPQSVRKTNDGKHKKFVYEQEVLELLQVIDGSKGDDELLGFLDYDKIKLGKMCRHIVVVLPYCASCDALETLIATNRDKFKNLGGYEIINISGVDSGKVYKTPDNIKQKIKDCESADKKTVTLTVNRMLTGSTVPEWDTMLYLKDTASPQEYDQAIFRLQNQYIKTYVDGNGDSIKYNMKPQTLLVDFYPDRMFLMQEKKAQIYNVNVDEAGNSELGKRLAEELRISPIVRLNKDKIVQVSATDILEAVSNYKKDKGIKEEALDTPVDLDILKYDLVRSTIEKENEIGSKNGLALPAHKGLDDDDGDIIDTPDTETGDDDTPTTHPSQSETNVPDEKREQISFTKKIQSYYTKILLFAFITDDKVISVKDIIDKMDLPDNARIAKNLGLDKAILTLFNGHNKWVLRQLDYKIQDLSNLAHDEKLSPLEKADIAANKFGKLGDAIVVTPSKICDDMVGLLPDGFMLDVASKNGRILDIAGTSGEFAAAVYKRALSLGIGADVIKNLIYTIPKSPICYELTRKLYKMLGLNTDNIATKFIATDLLGIKSGKDLDYGKIKRIILQKKNFSEISLSDNPAKGDEMIKFDAIVGNPPYQETDGGHGMSASPIYNKYVELSKKINPAYFSMILPSRWFTGGKGLDDFRESMLSDTSLRHLYDYENFRDVFPGVDVAGGVCYFLWDRDNKGKCLVSNFDGTNYSFCERSLNEYTTFIRSNNAVAIVNKVSAWNKSCKSLSDVVSSRKPFGLPTNYSPKNNGIPCWFIQKIGLKYADSNDIDDSRNLLNKWKMLAPKSPIAGQTDFSKPVGFYYDGNTIIAKPGECCTESFIVLGAFDTQEEVLNYKSYVFTKLVRFLLLQSVVSQDVTKKNFKFIPDLGKYDRQYTDEYLCQLWGITDEEWAYVDSKIANIKNN